MKRMLHIDEVCEYLAERDYNESLFAMWNATAEPTTLRGGDLVEEYALWTDDTTELLTSFNDSSLNVTQGPKNWYDVILELRVTHTKFRELTEWYAIPGISSIGILCNICAIILLFNFRSMRRNSSRLHILLLFIDTLYLGLCLTFTQLRHYGFPTSVKFKMEAMQYFCMTLSFFQLISIWILYIAATDAYRHFNSFRKASSLLKLMKTPRNLCLVFLFAVLFCVPFVPVLRIMVWELDYAPHRPCTSPVENHWNYVINDVPSRDLYYILYFTVIYYLVWYAVPFFMVGCRNKDIIDCLQTMQERHGLPLVALQAGHTAFMISVLCNISLFCLVPKLALMTFKLFEFAVHYMTSAHRYFLYVNEVANLLQVARAGAYLPVLLRFSPYSRHVFKHLFCRCLKRWPIREKEEVPIIQVDSV